MKIQPSLIKTFRLPIKNQSYPYSLFILQIRKKDFSQLAAKPLNFKKEYPLKTDLDKITYSKFNDHPFKTGITRLNAEQIMRKYLSMSEAFPYLQAASHKKLIFQTIKKNIPISPEVEKTFVVGSFLSWDETGGNHLMIKKGLSALPEILKTRDYFHANLLKKDLECIFKKNISPFYCPETKRYLLNLEKSLGSINHLKRCATMVAFEMHAGQMIESLWSSLSSALSLNKDDLNYFKIHVGEDDPAEIHHIKTTQKLIDSITSNSSKKTFFKHFEKAYRENINWCEAIKKGDMA